jgi:hypothetical protein
MSTHYSKTLELIPRVSQKFLQSLCPKGEMRVNQNILTVLKIDKKGDKTDCTYYRGI